MKRNANAKTATATLRRAEATDLALAIRRRLLAARCDCNSVAWRERQISGRQSCFEQCTKFYRFDTFGHHGPRCHLAAKIEFGAGAGGKPGGNRCEQTKPICSAAPGSRRSNRTPPKRS